MSDGIPVMMMDGKRLDLSDIGVKHIGIGETVSVPRNNTNHSRPVLKNWTLVGYLHVYSRFDDGVVREIERHAMWAKDPE